MAEIVSEVMVDDKTGLTFVEDIRGFWHLVPEFKPPKDKETFYLQQIVKDHNWPDTKSFYSLPTPLTFKKNVETYLSYIIANHDFKNSYGTGAIGLFIDNDLKISLTLSKSINYIAYNPILIKKNKLCEIKYQPFNKRADLGITAEFYSLL